MTIKGRATVTKNADDMLKTCGSETKRLLMKMDMGGFVLHSGSERGNCDRVIHGDRPELLKCHLILCLYDSVLNTEVSLAISQIH